MNRIGTIYRSIADGCLAAWYPDMPSAERNALLKRGDLKEIEDYIGAKNSIDAAIEAIRKNLEKYQITLPANFADIVYFSDTPHDDVKELVAKIGKNHAIDDYVMANMAVRMLAGIHMRWIDDNKKKFFDPRRYSKRFLFLPIKMIGWEEVLKDYIFLSPILQLLCIRPETYIIKKAYKWSCQSFFDDMSGTDRRKNIAIQEIRDNLLYMDEDITDEEVEDIVKQVIARCPVPATE